MATDPRLRASDADRDRAAALLREHHAAGRLTAEEFGERLDRAYAATTMGELDQLLSDLPAIDLYELPDASAYRDTRGLPRGPGMVARREAGRLSPAWGAAWASWMSVSLITFLVWLLTGHPDSFWFLWVAGPYALVLLGRWLSGGPAHGHRRRS
jgi:Domain of unknown function (DUF1707)